MDINKLFEIAELQGHAHGADDAHDYVVIDHYDYFSVATYEKGTINRTDYYHVQKER